MRLIDADDFEANMQNEWERNEISNGEWIHFREMINNEPTIEAIPVLHWRWKGEGLTDYRCSSCGWLDTSRVRTHFCPNCGASMTEGVKE